MAMAAEVPQAICRYYSTTGGCRFGDRCWFRHEEGENVGLPTNPGSTRMCRFFMSPKGCRFGDSCHFRHITPETDGHDMQRLSELFSGVMLIEHAVTDINNNDDDEKTDGEDEDKIEVEEEEEEGEMEEKGEIKTVVCGECNEVIKSCNVEKALTKHYMTMFQQFDKPHTQFISLDWRFYREVMCDTCFIFFDNSLSMFRHIADKSKLKKRDGPEHREDLRGIVDTFVRRDMGVETEVPFQEILMTLLTEDNIEEEEGDFNPEDHEYFGVPLRQTSTLEKARELTKQNSLDEERMENFGFTNEEVMELLCQGIKPWDDEAYDALEVLYS
ncbi:uncharacterized protein LOC126821246 [Patella vulgata]|uniref:uncharacterized protein LOC126821246 n=1 Tax=Patella vulgata TaxID=6465 RepID=UPI0021802336|nr:uncharacterized protein LOC126821246 [Patella vulgata]